MTRHVATNTFDKNIKTCLALVAVSLLAGCGNRSMSDLELYVKERRQAHAGYVEPLPEFELSLGFIYEPAGLRDPFLRPERYDTLSGVDQGGANSPDFSRTREALENYSLDALAMVGELTQSENRWGLVRDAEGVIHRVKPGNYAGKNFGRILAIAEAHIEIEETVRDGAGNWITRQAKLTLGDE